MSSSHRHVHLVAIVGRTSHHSGSWRHPSAPVDSGMDIEYQIAEAKKAEKALLDALFVAEFYSSRTSALDTFSLLSAIAAETSHIGLINTIPTVYNEPYHIALLIASLDHLSRGRAGWNFVTGAESAAHNFNRGRHPSHSETTLVLNGSWFGHLIYDNLVYLDDKGNIQPWLAKSWTISPDGKTYTFYLRDNVIEDQDQWWMGGLHREVYVYATAPVYLADLFAIGSLENNYQDGRLKVSSKVGFPAQPEENWQIEAQLFDPKGKAVFPKPLRSVVPVGAHGSWPRLQAEFDQPIRKPMPWSAELPSKNIRAYRAVSSGNGSITVSSKRPRTARSTGPMAGILATSRMT